MCIQLEQQIRVIRGVDDHRDPIRIFCACPQHCRPTNVNIFNHILVARIAFGEGFAKGVEIDHQQINGPETRIRECRGVVWQITPGKKPRVDRWVEGFDTTI